MSNLAMEREKQTEQTSSVPKQAPKARTTKVTRFEKLLYGMFIAFLLYACITLIGNKADLYKVNADFSKLQRSIEEQKKINDDLKAEVEQLSRYDRIAKKAKEMGLEVNEDNVKGLNQ